MIQHGSSRHQNITTSSFKKRKTKECRRSCGSQRRCATPHHVRITSFPAAWCGCILYVVRRRVVLPGLLMLYNIHVKSYWTTRLDVDSILCKSVRLRRFDIGCTNIGEPTEAYRPEYGPVPSTNRDEGEMNGLQLCSV